MLITMLFTFALRTTLYSRDAFSQYSALLARAQMANPEFEKGAFLILRDDGRLDIVYWQKSERLSTSFRAVFLNIASPRCTHIRSPTRFRHLAIGLKGSGSICR